MGRILRRVVRVGHESNRFACRLHARRIERYFVGKTNCTPEEFLCRSLLNGLRHGLLGSPPQSLREGYDSATAPVPFREVLSRASAAPALGAPTQQNRDRPAASERRKGPCAGEFEERRCRASVKIWRTRGIFLFGFFPRRQIAR